MTDFIETFNKHEEACSGMILWLNENADFLSKEWALHHSGGGFTHYRAEGDVDGRQCYFLLCHDGVAEPDPMQEEACWTLSANQTDKAGEDVSFAVLAEDFKDARDAVKAAKEAVKNPEWEDLSAPPAPR
ncbi:hypothetical protein [Sulfitobacter sp. R18_1]|uniref:hypothetical protein n=1 Tax=Sulfitobacter sp. R18_1 TaxID=2821104 RepID=UPI001ADAA828|nr:hypothetical protein [Sulfitobacter sp. R18_1]MBO9428723.1 hypothetical protein [Sulfitobacter sp. R18_1]